MYNVVITHYVCNATHMRTLIYKILSCNEFISINQKKMQYCQWYGKPIAVLMLIRLGNLRPVV